MTDKQSLKGMIAELRPLFRFSSAELNTTFQAALQMEKKAEIESSIVMKQVLFATAVKMLNDVATEIALRN